MVNALARASTCGRVADVALNEFKGRMIAEEINVGRKPGENIVQDAHLARTSLQQVFGNVRTDKARASGNKKVLAGKVFVVKAVHYRLQYWRLLILSR